MVVTISLAVGSLSPSFQTADSAGLGGHRILTAAKFFGDPSIRRLSIYDRGVAFAILLAIGSHSPSRLATDTI